MLGQMVITKDEYEDLLQNTLKYEMLLEALYNESFLNFNKTGLMVESSSIDKFLKVFDKFDYNKKLSELIEKERKTMNQINLIGRLTKDPEIRQTQNNKVVCEFDIAVNRIGQEQTDFITCVVWEKQAENLVKYQNKGSLVAVNGALRVDKYQNQEGQNRYKTYVLATNIEYLGNKKEETLEVSEEVQTKAEDLFGKDGLRNTPIDDSDLPF